MFKNGELVNINNKTLAEFNPWTVLDANSSLLGSKSFNGHYGDENTKDTDWDGHCWYIPKVLWEVADFKLENE